MCASSRPVPSLRSVVVAGLQGGVWLAYGTAYYLTLRPYQPFGDLLWKQTLIATASGLLLSLGLGVVYRAIGLRRRSPVGQAALILGGGAAMGMLWYQVKEWGTDWINPFIAPVVGVSALRPGEGSILSGLPAFPIVMLTWSGFYLGIAQWYEHQRQERRRLRADAEAQRARLRMLRYQLNPHFFFNALNTIRALADEAPSRVKTVVRELSGFLRYTLLDEDELEASLREEIDAVEHYLAVENIRFEDDLQVDVEVSDEAGRHVIPSFLVLPLVENAVKHGRRTSPLPLRIHISGVLTTEALVITIANTGQWRERSDAPTGTDTGLGNVRARLNAQYPEHHQLTMTETDGWVRVQITIDQNALSAHD